MRTKDDMRPAYDHLHAARKFTNFWGHQDDRKNAGRHVYQAAVFALKVHARSMGCVLTDGCDLSAVLDSILKMNPAFLSGHDLNESTVRGIGDWARLDPYDGDPAPVKADLLAAISIVETLSVPHVDLMNRDVEPTDEELSALMREVTKGVIARANKVGK